MIAWGGAKRNPGNPNGTKFHSAESPRSGRQKIAWGEAIAEPQETEFPNYFSPSPRSGRHIESEAPRWGGRRLRILGWYDLACVSQTRRVTTWCVAPFGGLWGNGGAHVPFLGLTP